MALYRQGKAAMDANGIVTGTGTNWQSALTLIRPGATILFLSSPIQMAVVNKVVSDTQINAITTNGAIVPSSDYAILLSDSLTVDGLAQDVAETLRHYQSQETVIAEALDFFKDFDLATLQALVEQVKEDAAASHDAASASQEAASASQEASSASQEAAAESQEAAAASQDAAADAEATRDEIQQIINDAGEQSTLVVLAQPEGSAKIGASRIDYLDPVNRGDNVREAISALMMKPHEYMHLIPESAKNGSTDYQKWNWDAAFEVIIQKALAERAVTIGGFSVGQYYLGIGIELPYGIFNLTHGFNLEPQGTGTGMSFRTLLFIKGQGMFNSLLNVPTNDVTLFDARKISVIADDIGIRFSGNNGRAFQFGDASQWLPASKCYLRRVLIAGACDGIYSRHIFDSSFEQVYVLNSKQYTDGVTTSHGMYFGPTDALDANGLHDSSNHVTVRDCHVETVEGTDGRAVLFSISGYNDTYAHHNFRVENVHAETHNRTAIALGLRYVRDSVLLNNNWAQTGTEEVDPRMVVRIENCRGIRLAGGKITTNNIKTSYNASYDKLIHIIGNCINVSIDDGLFFSTAYSTLTAYNRNFENTVIDYSAATYGKNACFVGLYRLNDVSFMMGQNDLLLVDPALMSRRFRLKAKNNTLTLSYSSDITGATAETDIVDISANGAIQTRDNINLGIKNGTAGTRGMKGYTNGDGATVMGRVDIDSAGRIYFGAVQDANVWVMGSSALNPTNDNTVSLGQASQRIASSYVVNRRWSSTVFDSAGTGSPEGIVTAGVGSTYRRFDGAANTSVYFKETGTGNTGWVAK